MPHLPAVRPRHASVRCAGATRAGVRCGNGPGLAIDDADSQPMDAVCVACPETDGLPGTAPVVSIAPG